jgi:hypothetical protein
MRRTCNLTRRLGAWLAVWLLAAGGLAATAPAAVAQDALQTGPIYWGANVKGWPSNAAVLDQFESQVGKGMSIVHWGQPWVFHGTVGRFQTRFFEAARERGSIPMLDWGSWSDNGQPGDLYQPDYRLADIAAGAHDDYLIAWAQAARDWGHPFFLRFDHEMNGNWMSWSEQGNSNGNYPGDFVAAWRHVVDVFRDQGATNATWVWCPNVAGSTTFDMGELYPGDDYVDWTCLDGYNFSKTKNNARWLSFADVFRGNAANGHRDSYQMVLNLAASKPLMIGETASAEVGGSKADWIADALAQLPSNFPRIRAFVWFNGDGNEPNRQWPVETSAAAQGAFAAGIAAPVYASNNFANLDTSPIQPLSDQLSGTSGSG